MDVGMEIAGFRGVDSYEATRLMAIAVYGYCPEYKSRWESHDHFKDVDVAGVTHVSK